MIINDYLNAVNVVFDGWALCKAEWRIIQLHHGENNHSAYGILLSCSQRHLYNYFWFLVVCLWTHMKVIKKKKNKTKKTVVRTKLDIYGFYIISMRWWWCPISTRLTLFYSARSLKQQSAGRHAAPFFVLTACVFSDEDVNIIPWLNPRLECKRKYQI
jgi:hypothetical protein